MAQQLQVVRQTSKPRPAPVVDTRSPSGKITHKN